MDWDKLRIFHAAAEAGSFTHAGEALRMSQSAVSRQVSALEKELKVSLFHRHARGLVLTEQGEMLFGTPRPCSPTPPRSRPAISGLQPRSGSARSG
jgi:DNA-binding transcriptional LysR family regulator